MERSERFVIFLGGLFIFLVISLLVFVFVATFGYEKKCKALGGVLTRYDGCVKKEFFIKI